MELEGQDKHRRTSEYSLTSKGDNKSGKGKFKRKATSEDI